MGNGKKKATERRKDRKARKDGKAMKGRPPHPRSVVPSVRPSDFRVVGKALRKVDATAKVTGATRFAQDLEWDSLTVLDFVANTEDEFDVIITMNMQAEIETVCQLVDALQRLTAKDS